ncbi:Methyltransferase type 11 [Cucumis melo var. makuwa]|uniref:Methyltransferase type 11 n=2 Tax=Cucumis melo TaxID=3656 RepID=A0A5D3D613_CUCMM|nr:Methyltransferase type 11 [Cucumis melo var. makuwa]TYK18966.1 Methyltransferase type 11 [Cucumis melo var. makuwa]
MERHIRRFLNKLSFASITIATLILILIFLFLQTPQTSIPPNSPSKPHLKFQKSSCDSTPRELVSIDKKNKRLWSSNDWKKKLSSFINFFQSIRDLGLLHNHTKFICVSAGAGPEVMALSHMGVHDVTSVELIDSPPLVSCADPHNFPFFDHVFDLAFTAHLAEALFPSRFVSEMERVVRPNGVCVIVVEECGDYEVKEIVGLFMKSQFVNSINVTLTGLK